MNYYERHIGDYLKDTAHLSLLEHGVYTRLLDVYYTREEPIPAAEVARLIGARSKEDREALQVVLREFFAPNQEPPTAWLQPRCEREIARFQDKQRKASASANARWSAQRPQSDGNANASPDAMRTHSEGNAPRARSSPQTPVTSNQSPKKEPPGGKPPAPPSRKRAVELTLPPWVDATAWDGFESMRRSIKKPLSDAARSLAVSELAKLRDLGHDPTAVLQQSTLRSWAGLFPIKAERTNGNHADVGAMSPHGLQTMRNAQALKDRLFSEEDNHAAK